MRRFVSRRDFLFESCGGISGLGLAWLLNADNLLASTCSTGQNGAMPAKKPHIPARAKSVISLFMSGGVSHVDTFDPKPALNRLRRSAIDGQRRCHRSTGPSRSADAESVSVQKVRPVRDGRV